MTRRCVFFVELSCLKERKHCDLADFQPVLTPLKRKNRQKLGSILREIGSVGMGFMRSILFYSNICSFLLFFVTCKFCLKKQNVENGNGF